MLHRTVERASHGYTALAINEISPHAAAQALMEDATMEICTQLSTTCPVSDEQLVDASGMEAKWPR